MRTIQSKITLTNIAIALAITALLAILLSIEVEKSYFDRLTDQLETEIQTIEALLSEPVEPANSRAGNEQLLHTLSFASKSRITLISPNGVVAYDSWIPDSSLHTLENHLERPEVLQAREQGIGWNNRASKSTGENLFYVAKLVHFEKGKPVGFPEVEYIRVAISSTDVSDAVQEIRLKVVVAGLFVLLVGIVVSRLLAKQIAKPIVDLGEIIRKIQAGDLDQKLPVHSRDEIGRLASVINEMTDKLKADINQLRKLERVRSEFLGNVSHELRTPIFSLKGFLETLREGAVNDPSVNVKFVEKAYHNANRLDTLLNDLIEISRIESGEMKMSLRYFDVAAFLRQVVSEFADQASRKSQHVEVHVPDEEALVLGDKERLKLAVGNIIDNALKYCPEGATVKVSATPHEKSVTVAVSDDGPGIEREHLPRIFERFYRIDKNRSRDVGGTGLGLAIVKHIVEAQGSKIDVASEVGVGTTFSFELKR